MMLIALLGCVSTVVAYSVTLKVDVDNLKQAYAEAGPRNTEIIDDLDYRIDFNENAIIKNQERIIAMHDDIKEIKEWIKP